MGSYELPFGIERSALRLDGKDPYLCLHFVIVYCRDQERSLRFYVDKLGFRVVVDHKFDNGQRWIEVAPADGNAHIGLTSLQPGDDVNRLIGPEARVWFCSMVDCNLAKGDLLALYTDGVTEASNGNGEEFG